jgi:hypothetical protein
MRVSTVYVALLALAFGAASSRAQTSPTPMPPSLLRQWSPAVAAGLGVGVAHVSCASCRGESGLGPAGFVRVGGGYRTNVIIGLQFDWWQSTRRSSYQETSVTLSSTNLVLQYYPSTAHRWFVTSGLGVGFLDVSTTTFNGGENGVAHGVGYQLGVGYAKLVARHLTLTPYASYFGTSGGTIPDWQDRLSGSALHIGVSLDWRQPVVGSPGPEARAIPRGAAPPEKLIPSS